MELHPKQILEVLEKPLGLASNFIFSLSDGKPLKSAGGSDDGNYKPSRLTTPRSPRTPGSCMYRIACRLPLIVFFSDPGLVDRGRRPPYAGPNLLVFPEEACVFSAGERRKRQRLDEKQSGFITARAEPCSAMSQGR